MKAFTRLAVAGSVVLFSAALAQADVTYSDGTFNDANWSMPIVYQGYNGGSVSSHQVATGGNPGSYQEVDMTLNSAANAATASTVVAFHAFSSAVYNPAVLGQIGSIDFSLDVLNDSSTGLEIGLALEQNGQLYGTYPLITNGPLTWTNHALTHQTVHQFNLWVSAPPLLNTDISQHPDFSANAAPITLGYYTYGVAVGAGYSVHDGYDNWKATVHAPEPASFVLAGVAGVMLWVARRKRSRRRKESPIGS